MVNGLLQYPIVHIVAVIIAAFGLIISGILIWWYGKKYHNMEIFWVVWWLVITLILGVKFL